jgi:hypothetical protein
MLYHVSRNGQTYGPYTLEDLQRYVASGNVLLTDLAKGDDMADWVPVSQVLGVSAPVSPVPPVTAGGYAEPAYAPGAGLYPDPPNLHWALVLLFSIFTCGLFGTIWEFVQAAWMRRVNPRSNAIFLYIAHAIILYGGGFLRFFLNIASGFHDHHAFLGGSLSLVSLVVLELAFFDMRRSLEEHFNGPEPIGLSLSPVMTFFFGPFYFQYHMTRINEVKRLARYRGAAV